MVAIFTGAGAGFTRGSANLLGSAGQLGSALLGRGSEGVSVNAATGNLLVSHQDEFLVGLGPDVAIARTYNSLNQEADGDNGDNWQQSTTRRVFGLTGTVNTAGSTISRLGSDGAVIVYEWDAGRSAYVTKDGSGAFDTLTHASDVWTWRDGDSQATETYSAYGTGNWRITAAADTDGNTLAFTYNADKLDKVTTADGSWTQYSWSGNAITSVVTGYTDLATSTAKTLTRVRYTYDGQGRLETVTTDLTPGDNSVADSNKYVVTYTYHGSTTRIASIAQSDGSLLQIAYDGSNRVQTLTQTVASGVTRVTTLAYGSNYTTVTGPDSQVIRLDYDGSNRLTKITAPPAFSGATAQNVQFSYDADGNLDTVTDGAGEITSYDYDANGNTTLITDATGHTVTRTYDAQNRLITELTSGADRDGANVAHYRQYVYDVEGHLRFAVNAAGQTTEYRYSTAGQLLRTIQYAEHRMTPPGASAISLSTAEAWVAAIADKSSVRIAENTYDARGNITLSKSYGIANAAGDPLTTEGTTTANFVYDQAGNLLDRWRAGENHETFLYDGMGRLYSSTDKNGGTTTIVFSDATTTTSVTTAAGFSSVSVYNKAGELVSLTESGANTAAGTATYEYDNMGRLRIVTDASAAIGGGGRKSYIYYDKAGRKVAEVNHLGEITEYRYDAAGRVAATIAYSTALGTSQFNTIKNLAATADLSTLLPSATANDIWSWTVYDDAGRVIQSIDNLGSTVTFEYDNEGKLAKTYAYFNKLSAGTLTGFKTTLPATLQLPATHAKDTFSRVFYNKAGQEIATLDGEGYLTESVRDGAGLVTQTTSYNAVTNAADRAAGTLATLKAGVTASTADRVAYSVYDGQGLLRYSVNARGGITGFTYDDAGRLTKTVAYATEQALSDFTYDAVKAAVTTNAADRTNWVVYDAAGRTAYTVDAEGGVAAFAYDSSGRVVKAIAYDNLYGSTVTLAALNSWAANSTQANDTSNRVTRNWYNARGEVVYSLDAENFATGFTYDEEGRVLSSTRYGGTALSVTDSTTLANVTTALSGVAAADRITVSTTYDNAGRVVTVTAPIDDVNSTVTRTVYNALGQVYEIIESDNFNDDKVTTRYTYDGAGRVLTETAAYGETYAATVTYAYDGLGNQTSVTDARGNAVSYTHDRLGNVLTATNALSGVTTFVYDAFGNVVKATGPGGGSTYSYYDRLNRLVTVRNAENYVSKTLYNRFGEVTSVRQYATAFAGTPQIGINPTGDPDGPGVGQSPQVIAAYANAAALQGTADTAAAALAAEQAALVAAKGTPLAFMQAQLATYQAQLASLQASYNAANWFDKIFVWQPQINTCNTNIGKVQANITLINNGQPMDTWGSNLYNSGFNVAALQTQYDNAQAAADQALADAQALEASEQSGNYGPFAATYFSYDRLGRVVQKVDAEGYVETSAYSAFGQLVSFSRYEKSVYGSYGGQTGLVQETFAEAVQVQEQADELAAAAVAANAVKAEKLAAKNAAQTAYNSAQATANASASAVTSLQSQISTLQSQYNARPEKAALANNAVSYLQGLYNGYQSQINSHTAFAQTLPPEQQYPYYMSNIWPLEQQRNAISAEISSVQGGNPISSTYWNGLLTAAGYTSTQINSFITLGNNLASAQAALPAAQATAATDAAAASAAQTAYNTATTAYNTANTAATNAQNAANAAQVLADAALADAQEFAEEQLGGSQTGLPSFTLASLDGAATSQFIYDRRGLLTRSTDAMNFYERFAYDAFGRRIHSYGKSWTTATDAPDLTLKTTYTYDKRGLLLSETLPVKSVRANGTEQTPPIKTSYEYDRRGNLTRKIEADGLDEVRNTYYKYDKLDRKTETTGDTITDTISTIDANKALSNQASVAPKERIFYDLNGNVTKTIDAAGGTTVFFYDALNRKTVEIRLWDTVSSPNKGIYTAYSYNADGNVTNIKIYEQLANMPSDGGASSSAPAAPSGVKRETTFTYDALGRILTSNVIGATTGEWNGSSWVSSTAALTTAYLYDYQGNVIKLTDPNGGATYSYYDKLGRKFTQLDTMGYRTNWAYDSDGNVLQERRLATRYTGTPTTISPPEGDFDANDRITAYTYDKVGNRTSEARLNVVIHAGSGTTTTATSTVTYSYNGLGQVVQKNEATDTNNANQGTLGDESIYYSYDAAGRLMQEKRAIYASDSGNVTPQVNYYYDGLGNLTRNVQAAAGSEANARITTYEYGKGGRLKKMTDAAGGVRNYVYDAAGRLVLEHYSRAVMNTTTGATAAALEGIGYRYDILGRSLGQGFYKSSDGGATWVFQTSGSTHKADHTMIEYNAFGDVSRTGVNGVWQQESYYDVAGRVWRTNSGDGVWKYFGYDKNGNQTVQVASAGANLTSKTSITDALTGVSAADVNGTYTVYDKRNMATSVVEEGRQITGTSGITLTTGRSYNAFGEVASESNALGATLTYTYNTMGRRIRSESPAVQITLEDGTTRWIKPAEDYYYDASGRLVAQRDANGTYAAGGTNTATATSKAANTGNLTLLTLLAGSGYGDSKSLVTRQTNADGGRIESFYNVFGDAKRTRELVETAAQEVNWKWMTTDQTFDGMGRLLTAARPGGLTDTYTYDILGQQLTHTNSLYSALHSTNKEYTSYDIQGRVVSTRGWGGIGTANNGGDVTNYTYEWDSAIVATGVLSGTAAGGWVKTTQHVSNNRSGVEKTDLYGRSTQKTDLGGHVTDYTYDLAGRLTKSQIGTTSYNYEYFNTGNVKKASTIAPNWLYYTSSATTATAGSFSATTTQSAAYTYDEVGNRKSETGTLVSGSTNLTWKSTTADYDALGRLTLFSEAATGMLPQSSVAFTYDANGNIRSKTSNFRYLTAEGGFNTTNYSKEAWYRYDSMNRIVVNNGQMVSGAIVLSAPISVDFLGDPSQSITYNKAGQRISVTTNRYYTSGPHSGTTPYGPYSNVTVTYFGPTTESFTYTASGQIYQVTVSDPYFDFNAWISAQVQAYPTNVAPEGFISPLPATLRTTFGYDAMGRQTSQIGYDTNGSTQLYNATTTFNNKGQVSNTYSSTKKTDNKTYTSTVTNNLGTYGVGGTYAFGSALSFDSVNTVTGDPAKTARTTNIMEWWDGAVQQETEYDSDINASGTIWETLFTYNGLGQLTKAQINDGKPRTVTFTLDEIGQIIRRDETRPSNAPSGQVGSPHELWYRFGDRELGFIGNNGAQESTVSTSLAQMRQTTGNGTFRNNQTSAWNMIGFAQALDPINSYGHGSTGGAYTVRNGESLQSIAQKLYGDAGLWYKVAEANGLQGNAELGAGQQLNLPSGVLRNTYTDQSFRPYDPASAIGDLSPNTPKPPKKKSGGLFAFLGALLLAVIAIAVTVIAPFGGGPIAAIANSMLGSVVSQTVGVATGIQDSFSWKSVALAGVGAAVGGGVASVFGEGAMAGSQFLGDVIRGAVTSAVTQGIGVATGLQDKFSFAGVAAAGVSAGVMGAVERGLNADKGAYGKDGSWKWHDDAFQAGIGSQIASGMAGLLASAVTRSAIEGSSFGDNILAGLPDVLGQVAGRALGKAAKTAIERVDQADEKGGDAGNTGTSTNGSELEVVYNNAQVNDKPYESTGSLNVIVEGAVAASYGAGAAAGMTTSSSASSANATGSAADGEGTGRDYIVPREASENLAEWGIRLAAYNKNSVQYYKDEGKLFGNHQEIIDSFRHEYETRFANESEGGLLGGLLMLADYFDDAGLPGPNIPTHLGTTWTETPDGPTWRDAVLTGAANLQGFVDLLNTSLGFQIPEIVDLPMDMAADPFFGPRAALEMASNPQALVDRYGGMRDATVADGISVIPAGRVIGKGFARVAKLGALRAGVNGERFAFNAIENPGPLARLVGNPAANFRSGKYNATVLENDLVLYRAGEAGTPLGQWFTREAPKSVAQVRIDSAVKPQWVDPKTGALTGSSPIDTVFEVRIPKGTTMYEGPVGNQGGVHVGGSNMNQIFIEAPWNIKGVQVLSSKPIK